MNVDSEPINMDTNEYLVKTLLLHRAQRCGTATGDLVAKIWTSHIAKAVCEAQRCLSLADRYSRTRLELASHRAFHYGRGNYRTVKRILKHSADEAPMDSNHSVLGKPTGWPY